MFNKSGRTNLAYHTSIIRGAIIATFYGIIAENLFESVKKMTRFIAKSTDYSELYQNNNQCQNLDLYGYGA